MRAFIVLCLFSEIVLSAPPVDYTPIDRVDYTPMAKKSSIVSSYAEGVKQSKSAKIPLVTFIGNKPKWEDSRFIICNTDKMDNVPAGCMVVDEFVGDNMVRRFIDDKATPDQVNFIIHSKSDCPNGVCPVNGNQPQIQQDCPGGVCPVPSQSVTRGFFGRFR